MQRIPTRIIDVDLFRDIPRQRPDGSKVFSRSKSIAAAHPFETFVEAPCGFTSEPAYTRRSLIQRAIRCTAGEFFVVAADVRTGSPTFGNWQGFYLRADDHRTLRIPAGVACGWQVTSSTATLEECRNREVSEKAWRWLRWNDLELAIEWPEIPERLATHVRRSRSLATLPTRLLPNYHSSTTKRSYQATGPQAPKPAPRSKSNSQAASSKPTPVVSLPFAAPSMNHREFGSTQTDATSAQGEERILVIGSTGQLGRDLCRHLAKLGTVIGACRQPERGSLLPIPVQVDVSRPASIRQVIRRVNPTLIVNAAAMTDVDKSEAEPRLAQMVNATAPTIIADEAKQIGASIVHFCSNMVFGGDQDRPWKESDTPCPVNQYGRTKLLGTQAIQNSDVPHLIIRSGWLYAATGDNFVTKLVDLLTYRNSIELADDELGTPTSTNWLAQVTTDLLARSTGNLGTWLSKHGGVFHVAPLGYASRLEVGDQVVAACRSLALPIIGNSLKPVALRTIPSHAARPTNCRLDCSKLALRFDLPLPRWQQELIASVGDALCTTKTKTRSVA